MNRKMLLAFLGILASLILVAPAFASQTHPTYFLLPSRPGSPPAGVLLRNPTEENAAITLKAFNERGDLLGQISVVLGPPESKALFPGDGQGELPKETATVQAESDVLIAGFVVFGSLETPLEILSASSTVSQTLDFPYLDQDDSWTAYVLFNPNASFVSVTFRALDKDGALLAEVPILPLSPQETRTVLIEELVDSSLLPFVATVRVVADSPLIGSKLTGSSQGEDVTTEANNTVCAVTSISIGQTVSGALSTSDCRSPVRGSSYYVDRYSFSASAGQQVAIELTSSAFDTYLYLIGPSGSVTTQDDDGGPGINSRVPPEGGYYSLPSSGTYTIEVTSYYPNNTGPYTISVISNIFCADTYEPNDSFNDAYPLVSGSTYNSKICSSSDVDWYEITVGSAGMVTLTLGVPSITNYDLLLYNSSLTLVAESHNGTGASERISYYASTPGIYYIKVYGSFGSSNMYNFYSLWGTWPTGPPPCTDTYEPNDSPNFVNWSLTAGETYYSKICSGTDVDWYKITVGAAGTISLVMLPPFDNDYELELYSSSLTFLRGSYYGEGAGESINYTTSTTGTYYIKVFGYNESHNITDSYRLAGAWPTNSVTYPLTVTINGSGTVTSSPPGITCSARTGVTCSANFTSGTTVTLTATPSTDYTFSGCSGACSGTGNCVLSMTSAKSVTTTFEHSGSNTVTAQVYVNNQTFPAVPGITIAQGQQLTITATGSACYDTDCTNRASPNGSGFGNGDSSAKLPGAPLHSLICGIGGQSSSDLFFVGSNFSGQANRSGSLFCGMNENNWTNPWSYLDNSGSWTLTITTR